MSSPKKTRLCIETSGDQGSLALITPDKKILGEVSWNKKKSGQELATYSLQKLLKDSNSTIKDLGSIALSQGPGSFTGLRVGFNLAKTLCYSLKIPVTLVDSLLVQAFPLLHENKDQPVFVFVNAFKNLLFVGAYKNHETLVKPKPIPFEEALGLLTAPSLALGNGIDLLRKFDSKSSESLLKTRPDFASSGTASSLGILSYSESSQLTEITDYKLLNPLYLRPSQAEENLALGVIKPQH